MSSFKERIANVRRNPSMMQYLIYNELDQKLNSGTETYDIPDASLPFAFAMECGVVETAMAIDEMESISRSIFPKLAIEHSDLYKHMSDDDYIGRFASPARTIFELFLSHDDIIAKAIPYGNQGNRRLTIPRFTEFKAADLTFTMQYPIHIDVFPHGGINITFDGSSISPIETLTTNIVDWDMVLMDQRKLVNLKIPVYQMQLTTMTDSLAPATLYQTDFVFTDSFFHARAFMDTGSGWEELYTTHSDLVYDPLKVTVVFKVVNNKLFVNIPAIYTNLGMVSGSIRIDIYTTKGDISRELGEYQTDQFSYKLNAIDDDNTYVSPLRTFSIANPIARSTVKGGANQIELNHLRDRVIHNTLGESSIPITNVQLEDAVDRRGYQLVSNIDNITNRQFLATRTLTKPKTLEIASGAGLTMSEWILDIEQMSGSSHVYDNGKSITIKPSLLYEYRNGKVTPLLDTEIERLISASSDRKVRDTNSHRYVYSPFYTVMDTEGDTFDVRAYHLNDPIIKEKLFVGNNPSSGMQATISDYEITKTDTGYKLIVELEESDNLFKIYPESVIVQLGYQPVGESRWASTNSKFLKRIDKLTYYEIDIESPHDINREGQLKTSNFTMFNLFQNNFRVPLQVDFELTIIVNDLASADYVSNHIDDLLQTHLLSNRFMVVSREKLVTTLGYDLSKLWRRSRQILGPESYETWEHDVVDRWEQDEYKRDSDGNIEITLDSNGNLTYTTLHKKGDIKLDSKGNPLIKHFAGQPKLNDGKPILINPRNIKYEISMLMVDGQFYLGTDDPVVEYRKEIPMTIVEWLNNDIDYLNERLLEMSELYLYPTNTFGDCRVKIQEDQVVTIPIEQPLTVKYYLTQKDFNNPTLRPMLIDVAKNVINEHFQRRTIAISDIISRIKAQAGEHVLAIDVLGLGGESNFDLVTLEDEAVRLTIKKKLVVLSNEDLTIEDDINVIFMIHR